ncbi:TetR/AcrR family transcriptional regulator [Neobacillus mesonae]|uniref:TetR family transcriptional regulator n=1 Tax=Neobacillus mesonae TaxID=1193713 RepID=A0A3T0HYZ2_9BACI|nr:TetR/AcrR family transcriptional regulator [Neobacillus mesonae]AZU62279.1 TetR family transcriptional regulator [Neobacillus mesonae]
MSPRKIVQQELTRDMIMDAARDLFVSKGYQHVSMRQIAKELGYSHGAIYYHFKNKAELFSALVEEHFDLLNKKLRDVLEQNLNPIGKLKQLLVAFIEFGLNHQSHYEIMFLIKDEEVRNLVNQGPSRTYENFAQSISHLSVKKMKVQEIWLMFLSLHGFITHYCRHVDSFEDVRDLAEAHAEFLLKSIK